MNRRGKCSLALALAVSAGALALALLIPREPSYQGRRLSVWLRGFESEVLETRCQSAEAVRHIGTNALPLLTARLRHPPQIQEPQWKQKLRALLSKQSFLKTNLPRPTSDRTEALAALDALGPAAKDAVPAVEALLHENPPDPRAPLVLARLGPNAIPALTRALTNDEKAIRFGARACLDMLQTHSEILFPKTAQDAEFMRRTCEYNLKVLNAAFRDYKATHPEQFSPDGMPLPALPPDFAPPAMRQTNEPPIALPRALPGFE